MTQAESVSVAISLVLGLGVALVLTSLVAAFRARGGIKWQWIPIAWAAYIFVSQLQYWWGPVFLLETLEEVTGTTFAVMTLLSVLLFLAGALVLPSESGQYPTDLGSYFESHGRWGVFAYCLYWVFVLSLNNIWIYGVALAHPANITGAGIMLLAGITVWVPKARRFTTGAAGVVLLANTLPAADEVLRLLGLGT